MHTNFGQLIIVFHKVALIFLEVLIVFSKRELMFMFAICRRPSVCLSVVCRLTVCNVRAPYSAG